MKDQNIKLPPLPELEDSIFSRRMIEQIRTAMEHYARAAIEADRKRGNAKRRYDEIMKDDTEKPDPIEDLRFYCSIAMSGQDWLDVEPFFDVLIADRKRRGEPIANLWVNPETLEFEVDNFNHPIDELIPVYEAPQPAEPCGVPTSDKPACGAQNAECEPQPAEPNRGEPVAKVRDRGFEFVDGKHVPTVLVEFPVDDWESRDRFAAAVDTPQPAEPCGAQNEHQTPQDTLMWSEERQPDEGVRYNHVLAESPMGRFSIEWKGWKAYDTYCVYLDGDYLDTKVTLDDAKGFATEHIRAKAAALTGYVSAPHPAEPSPELMRLMPEVLAALKCSGLNVSLAEDVERVLLAQPAVSCGAPVSDKPACDAQNEDQAPQVARSVDDSFDVDDYIAASIARGEFTKDEFLEARQWVRDTYYKPAEPVLPGYKAAFDALRYYVDASDKELAERGITRDEALRLARVEEFKLSQLAEPVKVPSDGIIKSFDEFAQKYMPIFHEEEKILREQFSEWLKFYGDTARYGQPAALTEWEQRADIEAEQERLKPAASVEPSCYLRERDIEVRATGADGHTATIYYKPGTGKVAMYTAPVAAQPQLSGNSGELPGYTAADMASQGAQGWRDGYDAARAQQEGK